MSNEETTPATEAPEAPAKKIGAPDLIYRLSQRYAPPGWAFFPEFRSATGAGNERYADAIAVSLFPSRGLEIYGFEVKVSRSDLKSEIDDPKKADAIGKFCSCWYLVISDETITKGLEIPKNWGILKPRGDALHLAKTAVRVEKPAQPTIQLVASLARRVADEHFVPKKDVDKRIQDAVQTQRARDLKYQQDTETYTVKHLREENERLLARIKTFEEASGVKLDHWNNKDIGEAVKATLAGMRSQSVAKSIVGTLTRELANSLRSLEYVQEEIRKYDVIEEPKYEQDRTRA